MKVNQIPRLSPDNPTKCCARFLPKEWDGKTFVLQDKVFVRVVTRSFMYMPINMGAVMAQIKRKIDEWHASDPNHFVMMSRDLSPWKSEHYLWVAKDIPCINTVKLTGTFLAKVYEGQFSHVPQWMESMRSYVTGKKKKIDTLYFYYTTCPRCAKFYGKNYVVALAKVV